MSLGVLPSHMTREQLRTASEALERAADAVDEEYRDRIESQAASLSDLATRERGPDHGRLARIDRILTELIEATGNDDIRTARSEVRSYRETVEGV
jgi:hypothetical protein